MHSIPHQPLHIFSTLCKIRPFKSMGYEASWNVPPRNRGEGVSILGRIVPFLGRKTPPLHFSVQKG